MRIAYVTTGDVLSTQTNRKCWWPKSRRDIRSVAFKGVEYHIAKNLEKHSLFLDYIVIKSRFSLRAALKRRFYHYIFKQKYCGWAEPFIIKNRSHQVSRGLSDVNSDIVFVPESVNTIAYLECRQPIVTWSDTPFAGLINYYPYLTNLCRETAKKIYAFEELGFHKCKLIIFSSDWAADTAIKTYGLAQSKVKIVPFGANISSEIDKDNILSIIESRTTDSLKLLFFGVDWERKGGDFTIEVTKELNKSGLPTELVIVGGQPVTSDQLPPFVKVIGFLNKAIKEDKEKLDTLLKESHFLILPTRAEAYGHVFCEANAYGIPCLATNTGGIPTIIKDGVNGKLFSTDASVSEYCHYIYDLFSDFSKYKELALSSFNEYRTRLNWSVAVRAVKKLLMEVL